MPANESWPQIIAIKDILFSLEKEKEKLSFLYGPNSTQIKEFNKKYDSLKSKHSQIAA